MNIGILCFNKTLLSVISGLQEFFLIANTTLEKTAEPVTVKLIEAEKSPRSYTGQRIQCDCNILNDFQFDWVLIPASIRDNNEENPYISRYILEQNRRGTRIGTVCAGVRRLAHTGLLNNRKATTHWNLLREIKGDFPKVDWQTHQLLIDEGDLVTAGGIMAWQELALFITAKYISSETASTVSKTMLIDPNREFQSHYDLTELPICDNDAKIAEIQLWLQKHFNQTIRIDELADRVYLEKSTFVRRFKTASGYTPIRYIQELRIRETKRLLETTSLPFAEITECVGYHDINSFRRLFTERNHLTPLQYREKFTLQLK